MTGYQNRRRWAIKQKEKARENFDKQQSERVARAAELQKLRDANEKLMREMGIV